MRTVGHEETLASAIDRAFARRLRLRHQPFAIDGYSAIAAKLGGRERIN
jgi:hypothetical protein